MTDARDTAGRFVKGHNDLLRHGHSRKGQETPEYRAWCHIKSRCTNPNTKDWDNYGARNIGMCERWEVFENFLEDMGPRPADDMSIERRDNERGYTPDNCLWATRKHQNRNKRSTILTLDKVKEILASNARGVDLARQYGVSKVTISAIKKRRIWKDLT